MKLSNEESGDGKQNVVVLMWGWRVTGAERRGFSGEMDVFSVLTEIRVTWAKAFVKTY